MSELKGNFKAVYDVVKRAERCVLLRSKAANPSHTYAVGNVDGNGLVFGLVLKTDPAAAVREFRTRSFPSWSPWNTSKAGHAPKVRNIEAETARWAVCRDRPPGTDDGRPNKKARTRRAERRDDEP